MGREVRFKDTRYAARTKKESNLIKKPEYGPCKATHDEICESAMKHYMEVSDKACEWSSTVEHAIDFYRRHGEQRKGIYWTVARLIEHCGSFKDAEAAILGLRSLILGFGGHTQTCALLQGASFTECNCGWAEIEKALK